MKVILQQSIAKLGRVGDIVEVRSGYGRNYLIPQGRASYATARHVAEFEERRADLEAADRKIHSEAQEMAPQLGDVSLHVVRAATETGQLYGSVRARDVALGLADLGIRVSTQQIELSAPIKEIGHHDITVNLHSEVSVLITAVVGRDEDEIESLIARGRDADGTPLSPQHDDLEDGLENDTEDRQSSSDADSDSLSGAEADNSDDSGDDSRGDVDSAAGAAESIEEKDGDQS